jgi:hypothetical protein
MGLTHFFSSQIANVATCGDESDVIISCPVTCAITRTRVWAARRRAGLRDLDPGCASNHHPIGTPRVWRWAGACRALLGRLRGPGGRRRKRPVGREDGMGELSGTIPAAVRARVQRCSCSACTPRRSRKQANSPSFDQPDLDELNAHLATAQVDHRLWELIRVGSLLRDIIPKTTTQG